MNGLRRLQLGPRLGLLLAAFVLGLMVCGGWTFYASQDAFVGGVLYQRIETSQDLVADTNPSAQYLMESYLSCVQLALPLGERARGELTDRIKRLQQRYLERQQFWERQHLEPALAEALLHQANELALVFFYQLNREFLPAIAAKDRPAAERVLVELTRLYEQHRQAMGQVALLARQGAAQDKVQALAQVRSAMLLQFSIVLLCLLAVMVLATQIRRSVLEPLQQAVGIVRQVAEGRYEVSARDPYPDEAGTLLRALQEMAGSVQRAVGALQLVGQEAQAASNAKGEFLAHMSHEIRNPMGAIIGLCGQALKSDMPARIRDYLLKIQHSGEYLLGILNEVLDFSKIESGKLEVECVPFGLQSVIDHVVDLISEQAESRGLELLCEVDSDIPKVLVGDSLRLAQVLLNFANNAVKFTKAGEVRLGITVLESSATHVRLRFAVTDTGIGLTDEQRLRLFNSFEQADKSISREYGGTGLGLAISKSLVKAMQGEVGVESVFGQGSTFWFSVWLEIGSAEKMHTVPSVTLQGCRALVVDDSDAAVLSMCAMLQAIGLEVDYANSGQAAVMAVQAAQASGCPFAVAVVDWMMPGMDGLETVRAMRDLKNGPAPQRVMVTAAHRRQELIQRAERLDLRHVLSKPVNRAALVDALLQLQELAQPPALPASGGEPNALARCQSSMAGARILLVEDNEINQLVASEMLRGAGLQVDVVANGLLAVKQVAERYCANAPYDIVLMDMQMPVMDGIVASRLIRRAHGDDLPLVAMTANAMKADRDRCLQAGMNDLVTKPINPELLWQTLLTWVRPRDGLRCGANQTPVAAAKAPASDQTLLSDLRGVAGLDVNLGLRSTLGNLPFYASMLNKFVRGQSDAMGRIAQSLAAGDADGAQRIAHTLKGLASSLGASHLASSAAALEQCLHPPADPQACKAALSDTLDLLHGLITGLNAVAGVVADPGSAELQYLSATERAAVQVLLKSVRTLLATDDAAAAELWVAHAAAFRATLPHGEQVDAAIRSFNYELALQLWPSGQAAAAPANTGPAALA